MPGVAPLLAVLAVLPPHVDFDAAVRPVLTRHCLGCHSHAAGRTKGGLALDSAAGWRAGGHNGPVIVPGSPEASRLVRAVTYADPDLKMPPAGRLSDAEVAALTAWVRAGAPDPRGPTATAKAGDDWWSLRPVVRPPVPPGSHPIDAFVRKALADKRLTPGPEAGRRTLARRLTFDLHGLPPTPDEVEAFVADESPDAYGTLVDRLLASPRYGERWARHWLDAVHFADTMGFEHDVLRPNAWRYRDYVIDALNRDTPWPRFVREQLAADAVFPDRPDLLPALGFFGAGPSDLSAAGTAPKSFEYLDRDDLVTQTMQAFAGTTAHCARCHDHKFDPVSQEDYFALQAAFAGVARGELKYDPDPAVGGTRTLLERKKTAAERPAFAAVVSAPAATALADRIGKELAALPQQAAVYAATPIAPKEVRILTRGDIDKPGEPVGPGALSAVAALPGRFTAGDGAGRRAALADWLAHRDNPLTWRTAVNRVWHHHFGRGLCDTPNDLGRMGGTPSHPELLDWLAAEFRDGGGSLKNLHRLIVTSATYRQRSDHRPDAAAVDADNRLLWRMARPRLDADQVRDAVLFVSGKLDPTAGGPGVQQFTASPGPQSTPKLDYAAVDWNAPGIGRRSIYRVVWRNVPDPFLDALDFPDLGLLAPARGFSASPLQSLALFNNRFLLHHADALAARAAGADPVAAMFRFALQRPPTPAERAAFADLAGRHGPAAAARVLFNSSEFLFVD
jgi:hypothetical protein